MNMTMSTSFFIPRGFVFFTSLDTMKKMLHRCIGRLWYGKIGDFQFIYRNNHTCILALTYIRNIFRRQHNTISGETFWKTVIG